MAGKPDVIDAEFEVVKPGAGPSLAREFSSWRWPARAFFCAVAAASVAAAVGAGLVTQRVVAALLG